MKKRILLSLVSFFMMTAMWASLQDAYQIYVTAGAAGKTGETATLTLNMHTGDAGIWQWTCTVVLPEGVTFVEGSEAIDPARYPEDFAPTFTATPNEDGTVTFSCVGADGKVMTGTDGAIATFQVAVAADATPGDVVVEVKNAAMVEANTTSIHNYATNSYTWTIEEGAVAVEGDANGDGDVDIADYTYILNVMADEGEASEYPTADVNNDGFIDVADATYVLNLMADADE
ncbi:MAG: dockerin type I repeat-containing protein [Bacteroidaceae bacterium]|nr:dockerin type I repeat-containing protein [Bacteroidaceae bacterium]